MRDQSIKTSLSKAIDLDDSLNKRLRGFLQQIVANAARDRPMGVFARANFAPYALLSGGKALGISFQDGGRWRRP
jgi:hypothetical protein